MNGKKIAIIGGGNMGTALAKGILGTSWAKPGRMALAEPLRHRGERLREEIPGVAVTASNREAAAFGGIVVLAVKPQILLQVIDEIRPALKAGKLVISLAAGIPTPAIERRIGRRVPVVRAMPNIAAVVREAATAICPGRYASPAHLGYATSVFESVGVVVEVEEALMDAVTGLSGTGPMYVFQILEGLSDAGVKVGLSRDTASALAVQTLIGAAKLIHATHEHPARLKDLVTSPGGTAISALHSLERNGLKAMLIDAVEVASRRSAELGAKRGE